MISPTQTQRKLSHPFKHQSTAASIPADISDGFVFLPLTGLQISLIDFNGSYLYPARGESWWSVQGSIPSLKMSKIIKSDWPAWAGINIREDRRKRMRQEVEIVKGKPRSRIETCGRERSWPWDINIHRGRGAKREKWDTQSLWSRKIERINGPCEELKIKSRHWHYKF